MDSPEYDIAIMGAGPVGSALAVLLASNAPSPARIALIGRHFIRHASDTPADSIDPRTLALNHGSRVLLEQMGAWPNESASIETVHVSQRGHLGRTLIRHTEAGVPRLGSVVAYDALLASLHGAAIRCGVTLIEALEATPDVAQAVYINMGEHSLRSMLAVQSDGARPKGIRREYGQHAVLATVRASRPKSNWAYERFTTQGPLAILPHPKGAGLYGVVWCCSPDQAQHLQQLDNGAFDTALYDAFGDRLGRFQSVNVRYVFPLTLHAGPSILDARIVAIGNAAQTLHPVAGQGLNLGLRDAAQLSHALARWMLDSRISPAEVLRAFEQTRRADRWLTAGITDFLPRIFATHNPLVQHACGLGLLAMDLSPSLRAPLARHLLQGLRA